MLSAEMDSGRRKSVVPQIALEEEPPRVRGSVERDITSLMFDSMKQYVVSSWKQHQVQEFDRKKSVGVEKMQAQRRRTRSKSFSAGVSVVLARMWWTDTKARAIIKFKNGNVYEGDMYGNSFHGQGCFRWADGTVYTGTFENNQIKGRGTIQWKDDSWYTGEFDGNLRHGEGLFVNSRLQKSFVGSWKYGTKHGSGAINYSRNFDNSYEGEWTDNLFHGYGVREYSKQSVYFGKFEHSIREGIGVMVYPNHDVYRGHWKNGSEEGSGYYIWNYFRNDTMSAPLVTSYEGNWVKGLRHGYGLHHFGSGLVTRCKGQLKSDRKHGRAKLVTMNGIIIKGRPLFIEDKYCPNNAIYSIPTEIDNEDILFNDPFINNNMLFRYHITSAIKNHKINAEIIRDSSVNGFLEKNGHGIVARSSAFDVKSKFISENFIQYEDHALKCAILRYQDDIFDIYHTYSRVSTKEPINVSTLLIKLYFWQFCYDCNLQKKGITLKQIDTILSSNIHLIVNDPNDPFEQIDQWQFVHTLIMLASYFYVGTIVPGPKPDTMLASAFCHFIKTDVLPNAGTFRGYLLWYNFVPIKPIHELYLSLEEPRTVRKFLCATCALLLRNDLSHAPLINAEEDHVYHGKNCYLFGDEMLFVEEKTVFPVILGDYYKPNNLPLFNFGNLSSKCIIRQFADILPNVLENDTVLDLDVEINFYEFFEAFMACTEESIRVDIEVLGWNSFVSERKTSNASNLPT